MSKRNTKKKLIVYTDGSCAGNGKVNAVGGIGIHFPNGELNDVSKVFRLGLCTNQRTELYAILTAIRYIKQKLGLGKYKILIKTDSKYSIDCITKWVYGWIKNGWKTKNDTPVANKEFIELIHKYYEKYDIIFEHVDAHTNLDDAESLANAIADKLATRATKKAQVEQTSKRYSGSKSNRSKKSSGSKSAYRRPTNRPTNKPTGFPASSNFVVELVRSKKID